MEEFIPPEFKIVLSKQTVEFDTKMDKAETEIRRLSQYNDDLLQQIEEATMDLAILRDADDCRQLQEYDQLKNDFENVTLKIVELENALVISKKTNAAQSTMKSEIAFDNIRQDLNHQLRLSQEITSENDDEIEYLKREINQLTVTLKVRIF